MKIKAINLSTLNVAAPPPRNTYYPHNSYGMEFSEEALSRFVV